MNTLLTSAVVLADGFELDKNTVTPGVLGFLVVFAIGVGLYFLMRSLLGKLRALPKDDDSSEGTQAAASDGGSTEPAGVDASAADSAPQA